MARTSHSLDIVECIIAWRFFFNQNVAVGKASFHFMLYSCPDKRLFIVQQRMNVERETQEYV